MSLDPAMAMYNVNGYYSPYQQQQQPHPHMMQQLNMTASLSSPSSHGSEMGAGTPPLEQYSLGGTNGNGKRPASSMSDESRKKSRKDEDEPASPSEAKAEEVKTKPTRGSRCVLAYL